MPPHTDNDLCDSGLPSGTPCQPLELFEGLLCTATSLVLIPAVWAQCFNFPDSSFIGKTKCTRVAKTNRSGNWAFTQMWSHFLFFSLCLSLAMSICVLSHIAMLTWACSKPFVSLAICGWTWELNLSRSLKWLETIKIPYPMVELLI